MEKNRSRTHKINVFLSDREFEIFEQKIAKLGISKSEYIRNCILFGFPGRKTNFSDEEAERIAYIMKDKTETVESEKEINSQYQHKVEKNGDKLQVTYLTHSSCFLCNPDNPYQAFQDFEKKYRKEISAGRTQSKNQQEPLVYHARISFAGHECSQETALECGSG